MKKRQFIKLTGATFAGTMVSPLISCSSGNEKSDTDEAQENEYTLPALPYPYDALKPYIDARTMEIHYTKHHGGYVNKLNDALKDSGYAGKKLEVLLAEIRPGDTALRNNGGGHFNHSLFWRVMKPAGEGVPGQEIGAAIDRNFGSFERFKDDFSNTAGSVFGSGWAWLCKGGDQELFILSTPNQDNPLMTRIVEKNGTPILGIDVWEHAYYLKYQNRRSEYISGFFNLINWEEVNNRYLEG